MLFGNPNQRPPFGGISQNTQNPGVAAGSGNPNQRPAFGGGALGSGPN